MRVLIFLLLFSLTLCAESYEEFLHSQNKAFSTFKEERDKEFSQFLSKEWKAYQASQGVKAYEEEKPKVLPKAVKKRVILPQKKIIVVKQPKLKKEKKAKTKIIIPPVSKKLKTLYTNFFGTDLEIHYDTSILLLMKGDVNKDKIAKSWDKLAKSKYEVTIKELRLISETLILNDWAKYLLVKQVSERIFPDDNEAKLFSWFALLKMGYDAHISFQQHKVVLLLPVNGSLYNTVYYTLNNKKYYAIDHYAQGKIGPVLSYENSYEDAEAGIDFSITQLPLFSQKKINKHFVFRLDNASKTVPLSYNENLLKFFQSYPQVSYKSYFSSPESILLAESIRTSFEPLIIGKSQREALDIILSFVQNAFSYKVDNDQFHAEKVMFPSETLFYPYSDCEDRAILFSYMVKTLLAIDIVGVIYPNHMATAVHVNKMLKDEYISVGKQKYIVADPTYINARTGMSMPQFIGSKSYKIVSTGGEK